MIDSQIRSAARAVREAEDVFVHAGPELLAGTELPADELAAAVWGEPEGAFTIDRVERAPERVWADWLEFWDDAAVDPSAAEPRPVHERIAELVGAGHAETVLTENVFGLLRAAGVPAGDCLEFHGRADRARCVYCERTFDATPGRSAGNRRCRHCGRTLAPGVVLAGEPPARRDRLTAYARAEKCDLYLAVGTRLAVDPTAENAEHAVETEAELLAVGERPVALDPDLRIRDPPRKALPRLRDAVSILTRD